MKWQQAGVPIYAIGWYHGAEAAVHRVDAVMRSKIDEAHGDVGMSA